MRKCNTRVIVLVMFNLSCQLSVRAQQRGQRWLGCSSRELSMVIHHLEGLLGWLVYKGQHWTRHVVNRHGMSLVCLDSSLLAVTVSSSRRNAFTAAPINSPHVYIFFLEYF